MLESVEPATETLSPTINSPLMGRIRNSLKGKEAQNDLDGIDSAKVSSAVVHTFPLIRFCAGYFECYRSYVCKTSYGQQDHFFRYIDLGDSSGENRSG